MDSKTIATVMVVFICVLLFPVFIGILGGIFGLIGGVIGAFFGFIGWMFGAIFGAIGWMFGDHYHWHWPGGWFDRDLFSVIALIVIVVLIARSKPARRTQR